MVKEVKSQKYIKGPYILESSKKKKTTAKKKPKVGARVGALGLAAGLTKKKKTVKVKERYLDFGNGVEVKLKKNPTKV